MLRKTTPVVRGWILAAPLMIAAVTLSAHAADAAAHTYYSIHLKSFTTLDDANRQVNALKNKGREVFWKKIKAPGEPAYYRVYLGMYDREDAAVAKWKRLQKEGVVNYFGVHLFRKPALAEKTVRTPRTVSRGKFALPSPPAAVPAATRFLDNGDGTVTDRATGLMWIKNGWRSAFKSAVTWWGAIQKTDAFTAAGYEDWRLPTIEEWHSLLDTARQCPALVEPNPFENMISHMPYWSKTEFVYGRDYTCTGWCPMEAYTVVLYAGAIDHQRKAGRAFVMPVRDVGRP